MLITSAFQLPCQEYIDYVLVSRKGKPMKLHSFEKDSTLWKDWVKYTIKNRTATVYCGAYPQSHHQAQVFIEDTVFYKGKKYPVVGIEDHAWRQVFHILSVRIPKNITRIPSEAFSSCSRLNKVYLPEKLKRIESYAFFRTAIDSLILPDSVEIIDDFAFSSCSSLGYIYIPASVREIGEGAFRDCPELYKVIVESPYPLKIDSKTFKSYRKGAKLLVPKGSLNAYKNADGWKEFVIKEYILSN